ncbi:methyltransferase-like protein 22 [Triticum urartu]|uniref:Methyltransferase-like protein 22 n=1 Tax=Triticum urartu TaxID=4572 RepID=A0A8R7V8X2_TRIUA|nr:methyltransferase-like protein 22 [Triticum urartu]
MEAGGGLEAEAEEEQVMSEVHLGCPPRFPGLYLSRFTFSSRPLEIPGGDDGEGSDGRELVASTSSSYEPASGSPDAVAVDDDGDLVLHRRRRNRERRRSEDHVLAVQHGVTSSLRSVGLQVWKAAMLLTDFVLHKSFTSSEFDGVIAMEIGAGTGLVGLAQARVARRIFITDRGNHILDNCLANVRLNSSMLKFDEAKVHVRELDWKMSWPPPVGTHDASDPSSIYSWSSSEIEEAEQATLLFAADVIYSDNLTDLFFDAVRQLMSRGAKKVLYLTLEKRYNFSLDELDVVPNGYKHFRSFFAVQDGCGGKDNATSKPGLVGEQVDLARVPQYIREYNRGKDLEMWKLMYWPD